MRLPVVLGFVLAGCSTTPAGLQSGQPAFTYKSSKSPEIVASCIGNSVSGVTVVPGTDVWTATIDNGYAGKLISWRITRTASGSDIAVWRANALAPGIRAAEKCF